MTVLIHLLGAGDLGVQAGSIGGELDRLESLDAATVDGMLTGSHEDPEATNRVDRAPHHGLRPLVSALLELEGAGLPPVRHLVLIATEQQPPQREDTARLARLLKQRMEDSSGQLFGAEAPTKVTIVLADAPTLESMRFAVLEALPTTVPRSAQVAATLGSGSAASFLGVVLGCVEAGYPPLVVESNRQDGAVSGPSIHPLAPAASLQRWLAASGQFEVLIDHIPPEQHPTVERLAAIARLDWQALAASIERADVPDGCPVAELWLSSDVQLGEEPRTTKQWQFYTEALQAAITWRLSRADRSAMFLFRSYIDARHGLGHAQAGAELAVTATEVFQATVHQSQWTSVARDLYPSSTFKALDWLHERDSRSAHGALPDRDLLIETRRRWMQLVAAHLPDNRLLRAAASLGYGDALPATTGTVVVEPVGNRDLQAGRTPILDAVLERLPTGPDTECQIQLVMSQQVAEAAALMTSNARAKGVDIASLDPPVSDPYSFVAVRDEVSEALDAAPSWSRYSQAELVAGPGTKALLFGSFAAALAAAFSANRPLSVFNAVRGEGGSSRLIETGPEVSARLAHDSGLAVSLPRRVRSLDLGAAQLLLQVGSARWDRIRSQVDDLVELSLYPNPSANCLRRWGLEVTGLPSDYEFFLLKPRMRLWEQVAGTDPWRALYTVVALLERIRPQGAWRPRGGTGYTVWQLRTHSPYGHSIARTVPDPDRVPTLLRELRMSMHAELARNRVDRIERFATYGSDVLVDAWRSIIREIEEVAREMDTQGR